MNRFKVGDLVTGNELNKYVVTSASATCKVVRIRDDIFMDVVVLKHPTYNGDREFAVSYKMFKLVKPKFKGNN